MTVTGTKTDISKKTPQSIINIHNPSEEPSRKTLAFTKKINKIEKLEISNKKLFETLSSIRLQVIEAAAPIIKNICDKKFKSLSILETQFKQTFFKKREKEKIRHLILDWAEDLYELFGDERGKIIYDKYSEPEVENKGPSGLEDLFADIAERIHAENDDFADDSEVHQESPTKKPKTKADLHQEKVNLESKTIYRELMKTLHPDLELDEKKKEEKNEAAQKVIEAYKDNNIYELLKLRSKHLDQSVSDDDIKIYTKELNKRLRELEYEKYCIRNEFQDTYDHFYSRSPKKIKKNIDDDIKKLSQDVEEENYHQEIFSSKEQLRKFLREEITLKKVKQPSENDFFGALENLFGGL